jgi:ribonuclease HIII
MTTYTATLPSDAQERLVTVLRNGNYELREVQHSVIAGKKDGVNLVLYTSGKLVVQGKGTAEWIEFVFEPQVLQSVTAPTASDQDSPSAAAPLPRIGIDESGKGDFFGGMAIAAFRLTTKLTADLDQLGIRDSKRIKSDDKIARIASAIRDAAPENCEVMLLTPETYNSLVKKMGSVNRVLAWAHATVLENLLERHPDTQHAVADQFGPEHQIQSALKSKGKAITLVQRHRAESDPAVAAASILARDAFVKQLKDLADLTGCRLPPGATHVRPAGEEMVTRLGPEILTRIAKTHFRTTRQVLEATGHDPALLGTPEPKVWKKR